MVLNQGLSAASRILPIIDQENKIRDDLEAVPIKIINSDIKFNNVKFSYDLKEGDVLNSVNLNFEGGKMTSLVGHSGSGKSTILNLIPRFYDAQSGDIKMTINQYIKENKIHKTRNLYGWPNYFV